MKYQNILIIMIILNLTTVVQLHKGFWERLTTGDGRFMSWEAKGGLGDPGRTNNQTKNMDCGPRQYFLSGLSFYLG